MSFRIKIYRIIKKFLKNEEHGPPLPLQADRPGGGAAAQVRQAAEEEEAAVDAIKKSLEREKSKEEKTIGTFKLPKGLERELKDTQITDIYWKNILWNPVLHFFYSKHWTKP